MLVVTDGCQNYYEEVLRTAEVINQKEGLEKVLKIFECHGCIDDYGVTDLKRTRCSLFKGPNEIPLSFVFKIERRDNTGNYVHDTNGLIVLSNEEEGPKWVVHK